MQDYDLCLTWNWEHDEAFVKLLQEVCQAQRVTLLQITPSTLDRATESLARGALSFRHLLDRSSEADPRFLAVAQWAKDHGAQSVNAYEMACRSWNKASMHRSIFAVVRTPYTIILPSYDEQPELPEVSLSPVGKRFIIKPANGGGGDGVVLSAASLDEVRETRKQFPHDEYLLQTHVVPARLGGRPAWFRVFYCVGEVYPCWWATDSHAYTPVTSAQESHYRLGPLRTLAKSVAEVCRLDLFTTEIALCGDSEFIVVDYANDPIDLRLQSRCADGIPDEIARFIAEALAARAARTG